MRISILALSMGLILGTSARGEEDLEMVATPQSIKIDKIPVEFGALKRDILFGGIWDKKQIPKRDFPCMAEQAENLKEALRDPRVSEAKKALDGVLITYGFRSVAMAENIVSEDAKSTILISVTPHWGGVKPFWIKSKAPCDIITSEALIGSILGGARQKSKKIAENEEAKRRESEITKQAQEANDQISRMGDGSTNQRDSHTYDTPSN